VNLVLQGPTLQRSAADAIVSMAKASGIEKIAANAFRLRNTKKDGSVSAYCEARNIDYGWVPEGRRFADLKLLAMDMDSTLITIECIDELGDLAGKKAEIAAITAQAMRGELDFPASLRRRVGALAGLKEDSLLQVYQERLKLTPGADGLIEACKTHGVKVLLVSGGFTFFTERLKERLGLDYTISNRLEIENGRLTGKVLGDIVDAEAKAAKFRAVMSIAFRAKPVVRAKADCALNWCGLDAVVNLFEA
jgi:phosphoserine phosphatase